MIIKFITLSMLILFSSCSFYEKKQEDVLQDITEKVIKERKGVSISIVPQDK